MANEKEKEKLDFEIEEHHRIGLALDMNMANRKKKTNNNNNNSSSNNNSDNNNNLI